MSFAGVEFQFGEIRRFWRLIVVMVAVTMRMYPVHSEMVKVVNFMFCVFHYSENKNKNKSKTALR